MPEEVLELSEIPQPAPKEGQVLVKVMASPINDYDWSLVRGKPLMLRLMFGLFKPKNAHLGMELSGVVEEVGGGVSEFKVGDKVFGDTSEHGFGTLTEFIAIDQGALRKMPEGSSFIDAAAIPHAGLLAYQGLVELGQIEQGMDVLINGAGGGVGALAIQIAREYNCTVTGVDSDLKLDKMKALSYHRVIDYRKTDFTKEGKKYDLILDCRSKRSAFSYLRALKPEGKFVTVGGDLNILLGISVWGKLLRPFSKKRLLVLGLKANKGLEHLSKMMTEGKLKPLIDGPYPLEELPKQIRRFGDAIHQGKIVIGMKD